MKRRTNLGHGTGKLEEKMRLTRSQSLGRRHTPWWQATAAALGIVALLAAACGSSIQPMGTAPGASPAPTGTASVQPFLGTYTNKVGARPGKALTFYANGEYSFQVTGEAAIANGTYTVNQNQIVFTESEGGGGSCAGIPGTYKWRTSGHSLSFSLIKDACGSRAQDIPAGPWTLQSP